MKVTMRKWKNTGRGIPTLYDVLVDGKPFGKPKYGNDTTSQERVSQGRVLWSPWGYLPVLDGYDFLPGGFKSRKDCAAYVVEVAKEVGVI